MWSPSACNCKCKKEWKIDEYLDIKIVHVRNVCLID